MSKTLPVWNNSNNPLLATLLAKLSTGEEPLVSLVKKGEVTGPYLVFSPSKSPESQRVDLEIGNSQGAPSPGYTLDPSAEEQLEQLLHFLGELLEVQGSWCFQEKIHKMRHDLRAPLNVILGFSTSLQQGSSLGSSELSKLKSIQDSGESLLRLLDSILQGRPPRTVEPPQVHGIQKLPILVPGQKDLTVLVVDDQTSNRQVLVDMLGNTGAVIAQAGSAEQALRCVKDIHPDLIFMDCYMPGVDGIETTRSILELYKDSPEPPRIVGITSAREGDEQKNFLAVGASEVLIKPVSIGVLSECLLRQGRRRWQEDMIVPSSVEIPKLPENLPGDWKNELISALEIGSISRVKHLALEILEINPSLGNYLSDRAGVYDLNSLKKMVQMGDGLS